MLKVTGRLFFLQKQIIYPLYIYINLVLEAHAYEFYYNKNFFYLLFFLFQLLMLSFYLILLFNMRFLFNFILQ